LVEKEIAFVKLQPRKSGSFMITVPIEAVKLLELEGNERFKVLIDLEKRCLIYQL